MADQVLSLLLVGFLLAMNASFFKRQCFHDIFSPVQSCWVKYISKKAHNLNRVWKGGAIMTCLLCGCTLFKMNTMLSQATGNIGNLNTLISPLHVTDYTVSHLGQLPGLINAPLTHCVTLSQSGDQTTMPLLLYPANAIKRTPLSVHWRPELSQLLGVIDGRVNEPSAPEPVFSQWLCRQT